MAILVQFRQLQGPDRTLLKLPVHLRYQAAAAGLGWRVVQLQSPLLLDSCTDMTEEFFWSYANSRAWVPRPVRLLNLAGAAQSASVPVGDSNHTLLVAIGTFLTLCGATLATIRLKVGALDDPFKKKK